MNIAVAQSGGPTCAINASLLGVLKKALGYDEIKIVYGAINGIEGIINEHLVDLEKTFQTKENMELLRQTPSTVLGSCRYKLPDCKDDEAVYKKIVDCFNRYDIKAFFYIGGNDSMDTVAKLSAYFKENSIDIKVLGIPKTIDNDLCETDHTPGFGSAAKYVATSIQEITRDSLVYNLRSVTIIEIMGRHAGWLTASSCLLHANDETAPHLIYLPECEFTADKFLNDIKEKLEEHKSVIIAVSEGIKLEAADSMRCDTVDSFGHKYLNGVGKYLEGLVKKEIGCKVRSVELNVMQRCSSHLSSLTDINESELIGSAAVDAMIEGKTGQVMAFKRLSDSPYSVTIEPVDATLIANHEKFFPKEWINDEENNVTDAALSYFLPLVEGEQAIKMKNGLPVHYKIGNVLEKMI